MLSSPERDLSSPGRETGVTNGFKIGVSWNMDVSNARSDQAQPMLTKDHNSG